MYQLLQDDSQCKCELGRLLYGPEGRRAYGFHAQIVEARPPTASTLFFGHVEYLIQITVSLLLDF